MRYSAHTQTVILQLFTYIVLIRVLYPNTVCLPSGALYNEYLWLRPSTVSYLCEGEPPPPRSTLWGAYRPWWSNTGVLIMHSLCRHERTDPILDN